MLGAARPSQPPALPKLRLDKWLWQARFCKSRSLAAAMITAGQLRLNGQHCLKPGHALAPGDTLTFPQGARLRVVSVLALGNRRGPAIEAAALYADLDAASGLESPPRLS